jgi:hypothetical protein
MSACRPSATPCQYPVPLNFVGRVLFSFAATGVRTPRSLGSNLYSLGPAVSNTAARLPALISNQCARPCRNSFSDRPSVPLTVM